MAGAVAMIGFIAGCRCNRAEPGVASRPNCVALAAGFAADVTARAPLSELPQDLQTALAESLSGEGRVCLDAPAVSRSCNAGDARQPDVRTCCHFAETPRARLLGIASRVKLEGSDKTIVQLELAPSLSEAATSTRCDVPTCTDDRATARAVVEIRGAVQSPAGSTAVTIEIELDSPLGLDCRLPA